MRLKNKIGLLLLGFGLTAQLWPWTVETKNGEKFEKLKNPIFRVHWVEEKNDGYVPYHKSTPRGKRGIDAKESLTLTDAVYYTMDEHNINMINRKGYDSLEAYLSQFDSVEFEYWEEANRIIFYGFGKNMRIYGYYNEPKATDFKAVTPQYDPRRDGAGSPNIKIFILTEILKIKKEPWDYCD